MKTIQFIIASTFVLSCLHIPEASGLPIIVDIFSLINTILIGAALKVVLKKIVIPAEEKERMAEEEKFRMEAMMQNRYDGPMMHYENYRRKRSIGEIPELADIAESEMDDLFSIVYKSDSENCLEKFFCALSSKPTSELQIFQQLLIQLIESESLGRGFAYKKMKAATRAGIGGSDCAILFDSCTRSDQDLIDSFEIPLALNPDQIFSLA